MDLTLANNSCCCLSSSSSGIPRFSSRELAFLLFKATVLHSCSTSFTSVMYDAKPRLSRAAVLKQEAKVKLTFIREQWNQDGANFGPALTIDDMLRRYGLLVGLVAYFISFWRYEVYELCATINHKFSGIVSNSYVRKSFLYHLVDGCSGDGEVVVVSRGRSHRDRHMIKN